MNTLRTLLPAILALAAAACGSASGAEVFVAPHGDDAGPGTRARPFRTLARARDAARRLDKPVRIILRGGEYKLREPLVLTPEDSGAPGRPVTWQAADGERVVLRGARKITGWTLWKGRIYRADLKAQGLAGAAFWQLFYKRRGAFAERMVLARHPNFDPKHPRTGGFLYAAAGVNGPRARSELIYRPGDIPWDRWPDISQAEVVSTYNRGWMFAIAPILRVDRGKHVIFVRRCRGWFRKLNRYFIQNVLAALDAPGEWFLDRKHSVLYFWPPEGELRGDVLAPALDRIVDVRGSIPYPHGYLNVRWRRPRDEFPKPKGERRPVQFVRFVGLDFECARQDALRLTGARECHVIRCRITNVGNIGVNIGGFTSSFPEVGNPRVTPAKGEPVGAGGGGQILLANDPGERCRVVGCDVWSTGCEGIMLYGSDNVAENCHVWDIGLYAKDCPCINLLGERNAARRNTLHDCPRCAVFIKGVDNVVELNDVHHAVLETCDMGAIRFVQRNRFLKGNIVRHNLVRETAGYGYVTREAKRFESPFYTWGVYLDDFTCGVRVVGNIITGAGRGGVMVHGGGDNLIAGNLIVNAGAFQVEYAPIPRRKAFPDDVFAGNRCERNVLVCSKPGSMPYRFTFIPKHPPRLERNLIWTAGQPLQVGVRGFTAVVGLDQWMKKGLDRGSVVADPKLEDRGRGVYYPRPDSPAWRMGFQPIPLDRIGCYRSPERASWPIRPNWDRPREKPVLYHEPGLPPRGRVFPKFVEAIPVGPIDVDFEKFKVGEKPRTGDILDDPRARITVTDALAASGKKCLRIEDAPGLRFAWMPRIYWPFEFHEGVATFAADFRIDPKRPARLYVDPRQYSGAGKREFFSGPTVHVVPNGEVRAPGQTLLKVPLGAWFRLELHMPLGDGERKPPTVVVTPAGGAPRRFVVRNASSRFRRLERVVISSLGTTKSVFYVDNVRCSVSGTP